MVNLEKALVKDAKELLAVQKKCFENYSIFQSIGVSPMLSKNSLAALK
jgi:hypothetical protein